MIFLHQEIAVFEYQSFNFPNINGRYIHAFCQYNGIKPKLALTVDRVNVNMRGFISLIRVKMKSKCAYAEYGGHQ